MKINITNSWEARLNDEFQKLYFKQMSEFVSKAYKTSVCYPSANDVFSAFNYCDFEAVKVVILGQDPYHGRGQANGLCFSVQDGVKHPPSLVNILKELSANYGTLYPATGNLEAWAKQGVLLLNATLTVEESKAGSHQKKGWEIFTDAVIKLISDKKKRCCVFIMGRFCKEKSNTN